MGIGFVGDCPESRLRVGRWQNFQPEFFAIFITRKMSYGCCGRSHQPRRAASILEMSILPISIIALKARLASAPLAAIASVNTRGVICQEIPQRSLHQPHALFWPPLLTIAFQ